MRKMMFSDAFQLTQAVLSGRKTQTRRIISKSVIDKADEYRIEYYNGTLSGISEKEAIEQLYFVEKRLKLPYEVGEVVAVAMSYKNIVEHLAKKLYDVGKWMDDNHITKNMAGWLNKMFVKADLMIFKIRITDVKVERLQDISDEDCIKEGVWKANNVGLEGVTYWYHGLINSTFRNPREAYAALIDKISGKGTWESNPYVFVYEFELVK